MSESVEVVYDGQVLLPKHALPYAPNTHLRITIEEVAAEQTDGEPRSFFDTARSLNLDGPADWSENVDKYLYGERD